MNRTNRLAYIILSSYGPRDFSYLSIGHNYEGNYDTWILRRDSSDLEFGSDSGMGREYFHDMSRRVDYKGRVDHDKKMISIVSDYYNKDTLQTVLFLLEQDYPGYEIWIFGIGSPKKLR